MDAKTVRDLVETIRESNKGTSAYDTTAQVVRIEDGTAWVHIPGGVDETPVAMSIHSEPGDSVRIRVAGGHAWIVGNDTAPPTDDRTANVARSEAQAAQTTANIAIEDAERAAAAADQAESSAASAQKSAATAASAAATAVTDAQAAQQSATAAGESAARAQAAADAAQGDIDDLQEYFWHDALGAHILSDTDEVSGYRYRTDLKGAGQTINRLNPDGTETQMAKFAADGVQFGDTSDLNYMTLSQKGFGFTLDGGETECIGAHLYDRDPYAATETYQDEVLSPEYPVRSFLLNGSTLNPGDLMPESEITFTIDAVLDSTTQDIERAIVTFTAGVYGEQVIFNNGSEAVTLIYNGKMSYGTSVGANSRQVDLISTYQETIYLNTISISYYTLNDRGAYFTFGTRKANSDYGRYSVGEGYNVEAAGHYSHAEGEGTETADWAHAEGYNSKAYGWASHAEGNGTRTSKENAHSEGYGTTASGAASHAEGSNTTASDSYAHAEGHSTTASGIDAHAEGESTTASGVASHAGGIGTIANKEAQTAIGKYNEEAASDGQLFVIGNGSANNDRSNAYEIWENGNSYQKGSEAASMHNLTLMTGQIGEDVPSAAQYGGSFQVFDKVGNRLYYSETARTTADRLYRSFAVQRLDADGNDIRNGFYLGIKADGSRDVTFTTGGKDAWKTALDINNVHSDKSGSDVSIPTATDTTIANTGSLAAGTYILLGTAQFASNATGRRALFFATSSTGSYINRYARIVVPPASGAGTELQLMYIATITSATTFYLRAYQNSGGNLNITLAGIRVLRIH